MLSNLLKVSGLTAAGTAIALLLHLWFLPLFELDHPVLIAWAYAMLSAGGAVLGLRWANAPRNFLYGAGIVGLIGGVVATLVITNAFNMDAGWVNKLLNSKQATGILTTVLFIVGGGLCAWVIKGLIDQLNDRDINAEAPAVDASGAEITPRRMVRGVQPGRMTWTVDSQDAAGNPIPDASGTGRVQVTLNADVCEAPSRRQQWTWATVGLIGLVLIIGGFGCIFAARKVQAATAAANPGTSIKEFKATDAEGKEVTIPTDKVSETVTSLLQEKATLKKQVKDLTDGKTLTNGPAGKDQTIDLSFEAPPAQGQDDKRVKTAVVVSGLQQKVDDALRKATAAPAVTMITDETIVAGPTGDVKLGDFKATFGVQATQLKLLADNGISLEPKATTAGDIKLDGVTLPKVKTDLLELADRRKAPVTTGTGGKKGLELMDQQVLKARQQFDRMKMASKFVGTEEADLEGDIKMYEVTLAKKVVHTLKLEVYKPDGKTEVQLTPVLAEEYAKGEVAETIGRLNIIDRRPAAKK